MNVKGNKANVHHSDN